MSYCQLLKRHTHTPTNVGAQRGTQLFLLPSLSLRTNNSLSHCPLPAASHFLPPAQLSASHTDTLQHSANKFNIDSYTTLISSG